MGNRFGKRNIIPFRFHLRQRILQGFKNIQIGRGAGGARIGRKPEQHNRNIFVMIALLAQPRSAQGFLGQTVNPLVAGSHGARLRRSLTFVQTALTAFRTMPAGKNGWTSGPVKLGQGNQHCGFNRAEALLGIGPLPQCLKLKRMRRNIRHIQIFQQSNRGL